MVVVYIFLGGGEVAENRQVFNLAAKSVSGSGAGR